MRRLFLIGTGLFWLNVMAFWAGSRQQPPAAPVPAPAAERRIPLTEVARHGSADDCWMAINGKVYDITDYLPKHPSNPNIILPWCGRESSEAYRTKTRGRPHSPAADKLLMNYRIGQVVE